MTLKSLLSRGDMTIDRYVASVFLRNANGYPKCFRTITSSEYLIQRSGNYAIHNPHPQKILLQINRELAQTLPDCHLRIINEEQRRVELAVKEAFDTLRRSHLLREGVRHAIPGRKASITGGFFVGRRRGDKHLVIKNCELMPLLMFSQIASLAKFASSTNLQSQVSNHLSLLSL